MFSSETRKNAFERKTCSDPATKLTAIRSHKSRTQPAARLGVRRVLTQTLFPDFQASVDPSTRFTRRFERVKSLALIEIYIRPQMLKITQGSHITK